MKRIVLLGALAAAWACGGAGNGSSGFDVAAETDVREETRQDAATEADLGKDVPALDGTDDDAEGTPDLPPDAPPDLPPDVPPDGPCDAPADLPPDVSPDVPPDLPPDVPVDAGPEAGPEPDGELPPSCTSDADCQDLDLGVCDRAACQDGACVAADQPDGTPCDDDDACTKDEACLEGACAGGVPAVACEAPDACHEPGVCQPSTGQCVFAAKKEGFPCDDGDLCTTVDACAQGACVGGELVACAPEGDCELDAACNPATGACEAVLADDGAPCDDHDACTLDDTCLGGACASGAPLECDAPPACRQPGTCDPASGGCAFAPEDDGTPCDDGNALNGADACGAGACVGAPCTCEGANTCCNGCLPIAEHASWTCDDGDACTTWDTCQDGACVGDYPVPCDPPVACHGLGACVPATGLCEYAALDDGTACSDGDPCSDGDACLDGVCAPTAHRTCNDHDPCTTDTCSSTDCVFTPVSGCVAELDCSNHGDDNDNGLIDCDDPHCAEDAACVDRPAGDVCRTAHPVNGGQAVTTALLGQTLAYTGDTTGMTNDYGCVGDLGAPDDTWQLKLAAPLVVTVTLDFAGDPGAHPWGVVSLYPDRCWPLDVQECEAGDAGTEDVATFTRALAPGTYYVVVDGLALDDGDVGPYTVSFAFAAPPTSETLCDDGQDDDLNGATDCFDPACVGTPPCQECAIVKDLTCGETVTGHLVSADDRQHYRFTTPEATDVAFTTIDPPGYVDYFNVNFLLYQPGTSCDNLYGVGGWTWGTTDPHAQGFASKAGRTYVARAFVTSYLSGDYVFTYTCNTEPESACADAADNDADSLVDCEDPDCFADVACTGGATGETCGDPFLVNAGLPLTLADVGDGRSFTLYNTTAGKADQLEAACLLPSAAGPDLVARFTLADTLEVSAFVEQGALADPWGAPGVYVFGAECVAGGLEGCGESYAFFDYGFAAWGAVLPPGTYHVVVDSGATGLDGKPDAGAFALDLTLAPPPTPEVCGNAADDEGDGLVDCQDPECFDDATCTGGHSGESCADPLPLQAGALVAGESITTWNTTLGRANDLAGTCSSFTARSPDLTHAFTLAAEGAVTAQVTFDNGFSPALVLFPAGACTAAAQLACDRQWEATATVTNTLAAGSYVLAVDGGDSLTGWLDGPPAASTYTLTVSVTEP